MIAISNIPFDELLPTVKDKIRKYYCSLSKHQSRQLVVIAREASIQLILQNAMIRGRLYFDKIKFVSEHIPENSKNCKKMKIY